MALEIAGQCGCCNRQGLVLTTEGLCNVCDYEENFIGEKNSEWDDDDYDSWIDSLGKEDDLPEVDCEVCCRCGGYFEFTGVPQLCKTCKKL